jgi:transposase, IS5 family
MFKILVLKSLYDLSDDQTAFQFKDRLSFMHFRDLDFEGAVLDAKTLWLFRDTLSSKNAIDRRSTGTFTKKVCLYVKGN